MSIDVKDIIMLSSIMLIFVGPKIRDEPINADDLFSDQKAKICGAILLAVGFVFAFPYQFILGCTNIPNTDRVIFVSLLITEVVHAVIGNSCSKLFPMLDGELFIGNLIILVLAIFTITYSSVLRSTVILNQTEYLPLMLSANIFLNGIVGLIIWEDSIINVAAYIVLYFFFLLGVYLVSDYELQIFQGKSESQPTLLIESLVHGRAKTLYLHRDDRIEQLKEEQKNLEEKKEGNTSDHDQFEDVPLTHIDSERSGQDSAV
jgi:hypothetical protein